MGRVVVARLQGDLMAERSCGVRAVLCCETRIYAGGGCLAPDGGFAGGRREAGGREGEGLGNMICDNGRARD